MNAEIKDSHTVVIETKNVTALSLVMDAGECPLDAGQTPGILIDGQSLEGANVLSDKSWNVILHKKGISGAQVSKGMPRSISRNDPACKVLLMML